MRIIFYDGHINQSLVNDYQGEIEAFVEGESTQGGARSEKVVGVDDLYSFRFSRPGRVLYTYFSHEGEKHFFVVDILPTHDYDSSSYVKLKHYLDNLIKGERAAIIREIEKIKKEQEEEAKAQQSSAETSSNLRARYIPVRVFKQALVFNEVQEKFLKERTEGPCSIVGVGGAGKTSVGTAVLMEGSKKVGYERILYLTNKNHLVRAMKEVWAESVASVYYQGTMDILSFAELQATPERPAVFWDRVEEIRVFTGWFKQAAKKYQLALTPEKAFEEFRLITGYHEQEYQRLGARQSGVVLEQRTAYWQACTAWVQYIQDNSLPFYDLLEIPQQQEQYDLVVGDEVQNWSHGEIKEGVALAKHGNFIACYDPNQSIFDENPKTSFIKETLQNASPLKKIQSIELIGSHRCPETTMQLAQNIFSLRHLLVPKQKQEVPVSVVKGFKKGQVSWVDVGDKASEDKLRELSQQADVCVIVASEDCKSAVKAAWGFKDDQLFTAEDTQGLQFKTVILWEFLGKEFQAANQHLKEQSQNEDARFNKLCAKAIVAVTRATEKVIVYQTADNHRIGKVVEQLKNGIEFSDMVVSEKSTQEDWEKRAVYFFEQDRADLAKATLARLDIKTEMEIDNWKQAKGPVFADVVIERSNARALDAEQPSTVGESSTSVGSALQNQDKIKKKKSKKLPPSKALFPQEILAIKDLGEFQKQLALIDDINQPFSEGNTLLHYAYTEKISAEKLKILLKKPGINANIQNGYNYTPLHFAIMHAPLATIQCLTKMPGINVNLRDKEGRSPIYLACKQNNLKILDHLLTIPGMDINLLCAENKSYLHLAVDADLTRVQRLLKVPGINVNAKDSHGRTPLFRVVVFKKRELVKLLLMTENIEPDSQDHENRSPLMIAVLEGDLETVRDFLELALGKIDINYNYARVGTYLHMAVEYGYLEIVNILLSIPNIDVTIRNSEGLTPLDLAFRNDKKEIAILLLEHHQHVLNTQVMYPAIKQDVSWLPILDKRKIISWIYQDPSDDSTPLMWVCKDTSLPNDKKYDLVVSAMAMGGNVSAKDRQDRTALFFACFFSNKGAIRAFLERPDYQENFIGVFEGVSWKTRGILIQKMTSVKDLLPREIKENFGGIIGAQKPEQILAELFELENLEEFERRVKMFGDINQKIFTAEYTLLSYACYKNVAAEKIQILLKMPGINVNHKDRSNYSALELAFTEGSLETIRLLLSVPGIDVSCITSDMLSTPMRSIDWNYQSASDKTTLLMWVCKMPARAATEEENKASFAIRLIQHGSMNVTLKDAHGYTALFYACQAKSMNIVKYFLQFMPLNFRNSFENIKNPENDVFSETLYGIIPHIRDSLLLRKLREMMENFAPKENMLYLFERTKSPSPPSSPTLISKSFGVSQQNGQMN